MFVFIDESGDIGTSEGSSNHFIMCALATQNQKEIKRALKKIRKGVLGSTLKKIPELKWSESPKKVKLAILKELAKLDNNLWYVCLCKREIKTQKGGEPIYDNTINNLIELISNIKARKIEIVIDRFIPRSKQHKFNDKLISNCVAEREKLGMVETEITIKHSTGQENPCLQAVDFVCGAIYNKYERGDSSYFDIIESKIVKMNEIK